MVIAARARLSALALLAGAALAAGCGGTAGGGAADSQTAAKSSSTLAGARAITVVARQRPSARLEEWTLRTPALREPTRVRVLLPVGYGSDRRRRYPVLYLLHGADSDYRAWTRDGDAEAITARTPMIVVMPDGGAMGWYTDWYQGERPVQPRWETYHVGELVPWIDATYRTIATRLRSLALVELRTGDGRPGPLDRRGTRPGCDACALERFLHRSNVRLHARLQARGIRHVWDDYGPGTHDWPYWQRELHRSLPLLLAALQQH